MSESVARPISHRAPIASSRPAPQPTVITIRATRSPGIRRISSPAAAARPLVGLQIPLGFMAVLLRPQKHGLHGEPDADSGDPGRTLSRLERGGDEEDREAE